MARAYTLAVAALAIDVTPKWLDNVLSHHDVPGVGRGRQGRRRQIPPVALSLLAIARVLHTELHVPIARALEIATEAVRADAGARGESHGDGGERFISRGPHLRIAIDVAALGDDLDRRVREAVEFAATPRRGRPPRR